MPGVHPLVNILNWSFSNFNVHANHLGILLKCRFWFSRSGGGGGGRGWGFKCRKSADHTTNSKGSITGFSHPIDQKRNQLFSCFWFVLMYEFNILNHIPTVCVCVCVWVLSHVWLFVTPWTVTHQTPLSVEFSRQEYWSGKKKKRRVGCYFLLQI